MQKVFENSAFNNGTANIQSIRVDGNRTTFNHNNAPGRVSLMLVFSRAGIGIEGYDQGSFKKLDSITIRTEDLPRAIDALAGIEVNPPAQKQFLAGVKSGLGN